MQLRLNSLDLVKVRNLDAPAATYPQADWLAFDSIRSYSDLPCSGAHPLPPAVPKASSSRAFRPSAKRVPSGPQWVRRQLVRRSGNVADTSASRATDAIDVGAPAPQIPSSLGSCALFRRATPGVRVRRKRKKK
jgi:hypothetical protein